MGGSAVIPPALMLASGAGKAGALRYL
jgi:hypothetical protein